MTEIRRKLYRRGSSFETTVPMPLLFALDLAKKHEVIFSYNKESNRWYLRFEEAKEKTGMEDKKRTETGTETGRKTGKGKKKEAFQ